MKSHRFRGKSIGSLMFFCGLLVGLPVKPVIACEPTPDNWYVEMVTLDASGLAPDFHVYRYDGSNPEQLSEGVWLTTNDPSSSRRAIIYLINRSQEAVYVLSLVYRDRLIMETPDENYEARVRMAHEVASYLVRPDTGEVLALVWEAMMDLDHSLVEVNRPTFDHPPADIVPPDPQHSELLLVYGERVVVLPFTISYSVNQDFDIGDCFYGPAGVPEHTATPDRNDVFTDREKAVLILSGAGLAALIAWLVWRWRR